MSQRNREENRKNDATEANKKANQAADKLGGASGNAVKAIRKRRKYLDSI